MATNLSEANGPDDKLRMAFKMYDKDSSGDLNIISLLLVSARVSHQSVLLDSRQVFATSL